jgi:Ca2+-binding EF-hand superfamily protein
MAFRMYDCNGDGSIDEAEMRRIISVNKKNTKFEKMSFLFLGYL